MFCPPILWGLCGSMLLFSNACLYWFCHTKVMSSFGYLHTTLSFHSMQNWNRWLYLLQMNYGYFLDVYKWQSSFSLYSLTLHVQNHEAIDMGILILRYKLALFAFNFVILRVMCRPSYIWICYYYLIIYLFSEVSGDLWFVKGRTWSLVFIFIVQYWLYIDNYLNLCL